MILPELHHPPVYVLLITPATSLIVVLDFPFDHHSTGELHHVFNNVPLMESQRCSHSVPVLTGTSLSASEPARPHLVSSQLSIICYVCSTYNYSQTSLIRSSFIRIPRHPEENSWLQMYSICHAYIQYVCSIIRFPRLSGYFCEKRMCAVMRGLTVLE